MWQDSQVQGPGLFSTWYSSLSSCLQLDAFWLLRPELSCQSRAWAPQGNLQAVQFKESKNKTEPKKSPKIFEISSIGKLKLVNAECVK